MQYRPRIDLFVSRALSQVRDSGIGVMLTAAHAPIRLPLALVTECVSAPNVRLRPGAGSRCRWQASEFGALRPTNACGTYAAVWASLRSMKASRSAFTSSLSVVHRPCGRPYWGSRDFGPTATNDKTVAIGAKSRPINSIIITIVVKQRSETARNGPTRAERPDGKR